MALRILPQIEDYPERQAAAFTDWDARILRLLSRLDPRRLVRRSWGGAHRFARIVAAESDKIRDEPFDPDRLRRKSVVLRRSTRRGRVPDAVLAPVLAEVCEAAFRVLGKRPFDVQVVVIRTLFDGEVAEMGTGEGKSLTAAIGAATLALSGRRVHVMTVNDYLAARDAETFGALFVELGLRAAHVTDETALDGRKEEYRADVVFSAAKNILFDYLRDKTGPEADQLHGLPRKLLNLVRPEGAGEVSILQGLDAVIVDEADSVLIDQAATPFILSAGEAALGGLDTATLLKTLEMSRTLGEGADFRRSDALRRVTLTDTGRSRLAALAKGSVGLASVAPVREHLAAQALVALNMLERNRDYVVTEKGLAIIDESTGRLMPDRQWSEGLHQFVELKEGLEPSEIRRTLGRITFQRFFPRYRHVCGMTGTARAAARELDEVYGLKVRRILPRRPDIRRWTKIAILPDAQTKWAEVAKLAAALSLSGTPVLIGTRSLDASQDCSAVLRESGLTHALLTAENVAQEAEIISNAGQSGCITVATNMAGRGTDILLSDASRQVGGLQVILTELHGNSRIDRQLCGRCGRQGDPGAVHRVLSLEDEIVTSEGPMATAFLGVLLKVGGARLCHAGMVLLQMRQTRRAERGRADLARQERRREQQLALSGRME
jgi:preprotein translocase subunit SecA